MDSKEADDEGAPYASETRFFGGMPWVGALGKARLRGPTPHSKGERFTTITNFLYVILFGWWAAVRAAVCCCGIRCCDQMSSAWWQVFHVLLGLVLVLTVAGARYGLKLTAHAHAADW